MYKSKQSIYLLLFMMLISMLLPMQSASAAPATNVISALTAPTVSTAGGTDGNGLLGTLFNFLFDKILGPIFNVFNSSTTTNPAVKVTPLPSGGGTSSSIQDNGVLRGKTIVVDPGHGGSNPGAVANNSREADNNLAVGLKLRNKLVQAGAHVVMTRDNDRTVAAEGSSLTEELAARVAMAEDNHADMFVSVHTNENPDSSIAGAMTFYPSGKSSALALEVQSALIRETGANDKGTSPATFYVLRNTSMPSILVEMGFISNEPEAVQMQDDAYRNRIANGVFNGIVKYFGKQ